MGRVAFARIALVAACLLAACENYPHDPGHTTHTVIETGVLRVGVLHNPPWTNVADGTYRGREIALLRGFAAELKASPQWQTVGMHEGFKALEQGRIDVFAGGLLASTPYRNAGFTRPYATSTSDDGETLEHVLAVPRGENRFLVTLETFLAKHAGGAP